VFHVISFRLCPSATLRLFVHVTTTEDDDEYDLDNIFVVTIDIVHERRVKYMLFYTHFKDEQIPLVWHRLNEAQRTFVLHQFLDSH
jgi:hypothetical protein